MRLPWLQIDADGMTRGEMLGRLLCIGPDGGIGITLRLWRWALEMSPDGDFSGGAFEPRVVAASIGWDGDVERLVLELAVVGLIERIRSEPKMPVSVGLVRIRGLDRYKRAWEKNLRRRPAQKAPVTGTKPAETGAEPARKTETETETDIKTKALRAKKPPADPRLVPLTEALVGAYAVRRNGDRYRHSGPADTQALKSLLPVATDEQILARWRKGLDSVGWASCSTFAQLAPKWNDLGAPVSAVKGSVIHEQTAWSETDDFLAGLSGGAP